MNGFPWSVHAFDTVGAEKRHAEESVGVIIAGEAHAKSNLPPAADRWLVAAASPPRTVASAAFSDRCSVSAVVFSSATVSHTECRPSKAMCPSFLVVCALGLAAAGADEATEPQPNVYGYKDTEVTQGLGYGVIENVQKSPFYLFI